MPKAQRTEVFDCNINTLYELIVDFAGAREFVPELKDIRVHEQTETNAKVEYHINVIKDVEYHLNMQMQRPTTVSWSLAGGKFFNENNGGWDLEDLDGKQTKVTYNVDLSINAPRLVPKKVIDEVVKKLTELNLPSMMKSYHDKAKAIEGN